MTSRRQPPPPALSTAALVVVLAAWGTPLMAWGPKGHRLAAASSMQTLPEELRAWYLGQEAVFIQAALEPDLWKAQDPAEVWRHRIFCETYGGPARLPLQAAAAKALVGAWAFEQGGQLPWVITQRHQMLVEAFRSRDRRRVISESGWLCHYVSDAQVPLHTTQNRNGKSTGQKGVHKRWETDLVNHGVGSLPPLAEARPVGDLPVTIGEWIAESHAMLQPLLEADQAAGRETKLKQESRTAVFWSLQERQVIQQLCRSAERSGALILSAWIQAGSPRP
ncbi:MAG: hypothetical protein LWW79_06330 [Holophagaceae bacterium]|nr:hypothetical protein [Holophagaceae bacterium]